MYLDSSRSLYLSLETRANVTEQSRGGRSQYYGYIQQFLSLSPNFRSASAAVKMQ